MRRDDLVTCQDLYLNTTYSCNNQRHRNHSEYYDKMSYQNVINQIMTDVFKSKSYFEFNKLT